MKPSKWSMILFVKLILQKYTAVMIFSYIKSSLSTPFKKTGGIHLSRLALSPHKGIKCHFPVVIFETVI